MKETEVNSIVNKTDGTITVKSVFHSNSLTIGTIRQRDIYTKKCVFFQYVDIFCFFTK